MKKRKKKLDIIYEDKEILVVNKPSGMLTVSTPKEKEKIMKCWYPTNVRTQRMDARKIHNLFTIKAIQHIDKQVVLCYDIIELEC